MFCRLHSEINLEKVRVLVSMEYKTRMIEKDRKELIFIEVSSVANRSSGRYKLDLEQV